jgi:hypothetical protein
MFDAGFAGDIVLGQSAAEAEVIVLSLCFDVYILINSFSLLQFFNFLYICCFVYTERR